MQGWKPLNSNVQRAPLVAKRRRIVHVTRESELNQARLAKKTPSVEMVEPAAGPVVESPEPAAHHCCSESVCHPAEPAVGQPASVSESKSLLIPLKTETLYRTELRRNQALIPATASKFIVPDFDLKKNCLMDAKYVTICYHEFYVDDEEYTTLSCSCQPGRQDTLSALCQDLTEKPVEDPCIHVKAASKMIYEICGEFGGGIDQEVNDSEVEKFVLYRHNMLFVQEQKMYGKSQFYGLIGSSGGKLVCHLCPSFVKNCSHIKLVEDGEDDNLVVQEFMKRVGRGKKKFKKSQCMSKGKISYHVSPEYANVLKDRPEPHYSVHSPVIFCDECNGAVGHSVEQLILFDRSDILRVDVHDGYCKPCNKIYSYDGKDDGILRMNGYLVHHRVLRDYMDYFHLCNRMVDLGHEQFPKLCNYANFVDSWYGYMDLLDIDLEEGFQCETCGTDPSTVVCDGVGVGFRRELLVSALCSSTTEPEIPIPRKSTRQSRSAIEDNGTRKLLLDFCTKRGKLSFLERTQLLRIGHREVREVMKWTLSTFSLHQKSTTAVPQGVRNFIKCLGTSSPVCSYLHPSDDNITMIRSLTEENIRAKPKSFHLLQMELPIFYDLVKDLRGFDVLPDCFRDLFTYLIYRAGAPFSDENRLPDLPLDATSQLACFPSQPVIRGRGYYAKDDDTTHSQRNRCQKTFSSHKKLMPGIFTVYCPHGICYGYSVMESKESPNVPFTIFKTRWKRAPKVVIYDFACSLHEYCLNRDPVFFKDTLFVVDRFHWKNHTACSPCYNAGAYEKLREVNTQINEQQNSTTQNLSKQLSYMTEKHFIQHCSFFMWKKNNEKRVLMTSTAPEQQTQREPNISDEAPSTSTPSTASEQVNLAIHNPGESTSLNFTPSTADVHKKEHTPNDERVEVFPPGRPAGRELPPMQPSSGLPGPHRPPRMSRPLGTPGPSESLEPPGPPGSTGPPESSNPPVQPGSLGPPGSSGPLGPPGQPGSIGPLGPQGSLKPPGPPTISFKNTLNGRYHGT